MSGYINEARGKTVIINLNSDDVVGLIIEWADAYKLPEWEEKMIRDMLDKYASANNQPTEEEKIHFITAFAFSGMPIGSFVRSIALRFLTNYNADYVILEGFTREAEASNGNE
ncbi:MAG: hypothetical protein RXR03_08305 [Thermocladium sp.]